MATFSPEEGFEAFIYQFALLYIYNQDWKATEKKKPCPKSTRFWFFSVTKYFMQMNPQYPSSMTGQIRDKAIEQDVKQFWEAVFNFKLIE